MKFLLILCAIAGIGHAAKNVKITSEVVKDFQFSKTMLIRDEGIKKDLTEAVRNSNERLNMTVDAIVDKIIREAVDTILASQMDPMKIPDINLEFEYKPAIITYHGELNLWGGWLQDIITIHRNGKSTVSLDGNIISARVPLAFDDIIITYLYSATIMDLGPHGSIHGKLYNVSAYFDISVDLEAMTVTLNEFSMDAGELGLNFYGYGLLDWIVNLLLDVLEDTFHNTVVAIMDKVVEAVVEYIVGYINDNLEDILGRQLSFEAADTVSAKLAFGHHMPKIHLRQLLKN